MSRWELLAGNGEPGILVVNKSASRASSGPLAVPSAAQRAGSVWASWTEVVQRVVGKYSIVTGMVFPIGAFPGTKKSIVYCVGLEKGILVTAIMGAKSGPTLT